MEVDFTAVQNNDAYTELCDAEQDIEEHQAGIANDLSDRDRYKHLYPNNAFDIEMNNPEAGDFQIFASWLEGEQPAKRDVKFNTSARSTVQRPHDAI
mgnify:CR=1 FL=1